MAVQTTTADGKGKAETIPFPLYTSQPARQRRVTPDLHIDLAVAAEISMLLQSTLEWNKVLTLFASEARETVNFDSLGYSFPEEQLNFELGVAKHHQVSYRLALGGQPLGELTFTRRQLFSDEQLALIEDMICGLVYPLRNALLYRSALQSAHRDPLTGINNRVAMEEALRREIGLAQRNGTPLSMVVMDIDHFKRINDAYGHAAGDCALRAFADTVQQTMRGSDVFYRFGGEEFVLLLSNTAEEGAANLAERVREAVAEAEIQCEGAQFGLTVSLGVAEFKEDDDPASLFDRSDKALYGAKQQGRNRVAVA